MMEEKKMAEKLLSTSFKTVGTNNKALLERLLYTCEDIEKIYILIRPKGITLQQRLQEVLRNPVFTKLKQNKVQALNKIVPIAGDVSNERLGMTLDDEQTLIEKVSVVFHSAANVRFNTPLSGLIQANYEGTKKVLELAKKIKKLDVFVHISTSFCNNSKDLFVDEVTEKPPRDIKHVYKVINDHINEPNGIIKIHKKLKLDEWGNYYFFTKHMAEAFVANNCDNISTIIVRPSLVTSIYKEPLAGYTDPGMAVTGFLSDLNRGYTRVVHGNKHVVAEVIPADYVSNFLIVAAARNMRSMKCNAYNVSTGHSNPITWLRLTDLFIKAGKKYNYEGMPFPMLYFTNLRSVAIMMKFLFENVPTMTADTWLRLTGRQPKHVKLQKRAASRAVWSTVLMRASWDIRTTRAREMLSTLNEEDRNTFFCDPVTINWDKYVPIYAKGVKQYVLSYKK